MVDPNPADNPSDNIRIELDMLSDLVDAASEEEGNVKATDSQPAGYVAPDLPAKIRPRPNDSGTEPP